MIKTVEYWTWPEGSEEPHKEKVFEVIEPGYNKYYVDYTSEGRHYLALLTDMFESYIHADLDRFNKIKVMLDWAKPTVEKKFYITSAWGAESKELIKEFGDRTLVDVSFKLSYNKRHPLKETRFLSGFERDRFDYAK